MIDTTRPPAMPRGRRSVGRARAGFAVAVSVVLAVAAVAGIVATGHRTRPPVVSFGLLAATPAQVRVLKPSDGITDIEIGAFWSALEPAEGQFDAVALAQLRDEVKLVTGRGFRVVLDLGLQYAPSWVFELTGVTRFVDQYGDQWVGEQSTDVPNAVFDPAVRTAEAGYIAAVGSALKNNRVARVRVGGLLSGELRYPPDEYAGHTGLIWDYDSAAQTGAPVPGWRPGTGSLRDAFRSLHYYFTALDGFLRWQMRTIHRAMPRSTQEVLFPSFGLRPGMVAAAVRSGLDGSTVAQTGGLISAGLDWQQQVATVASTGIPAVVSTTWLDGPGEGSSTAQMPPIAYLALLAHLHHLPVAGENTGGGGQAALTTCLSRADRYDLHDMLYMGGGLLASGAAGLSLHEYVDAVKSFRSAAA